MILLALGSNLPSKNKNRFENLDLAVKHLQDNKIKIIKKSNFYETPAYPNEEDPKFINIVIEVSADMDISKLVSIIIHIEKLMGRKRNNKNEPRICDIDIIDFNGQIIDFKFNNSLFIVPHEKLSSRNFVLYPIREILPDWKHPKTKEHIENLIYKLNDKDKKSILKVYKD